MSFFSKDAASEEAIQSTPGINVRTMQDDLMNPSGELHQENPAAREFFTQKTASPAPVQNISPSNVNNQNPFLSADEIITSEKTTFETTTPHTVSAYQTEGTVLNETKKSNIKSIIGIIVLIIACILVGAYYFMSTRNKPDNTINTQDPPSEISNQLPEVDTSTVPEVAKDIYSTTTPNYFPIDTAIATPQSTQLALQQLAQNVSKETSSSKITEFYITDSNNTPLTFANFAKISGLTISQTILNDLNDSFSLYIYNDNKIPHIGLLLETKNSINLEKSVKTEEIKLVEDFKPLFLNNTPSTTSTQFTDGMYKNNKLRFINLNPETKLSLDYAITAKQMIIGTSMLTHHALLDILK